MGNKEFEKGKGKGEEWVKWWMAVLHLGAKDPRGKVQVLLNIKSVVSEYERLLECFTYV